MDYKKEIEMYLDDKTKFPYDQFLQLYIISIPYYQELQKNIIAFLVHQYLMKNFFRLLKTWLYQEIILILIPYLN